jgi:protein-tyrosine phosphatase
MMTNVLFVCTGNIFRSVAAEYSLRSLLGVASNISVSSAGTMHAPHAVVRDDVAAYLTARGMDVSGHRRRTLSRKILRGADLVIAMSFDHRTMLADQFGTNSLLFTEACGGSVEPLPDVDDLFSPEDRHTPAAQGHIYRIIDQILALTPALANRLTSGWKGPA